MVDVFVAFISILELSLSSLNSHIYSSCWDTFPILFAQLINFMTNARLLFLKLPINDDVLLALARETDKKILIILKAQKETKKLRFYDFSCGQSSIKRDIKLWLSCFFFAKRRCWPREVIIIILFTTDNFLQ